MLRAGGADGLVGGSTSSTGRVGCGVELALSVLVHDPETELVGVTGHVWSEQRTSDTRSWPAQGR